MRRWVFVVLFGIALPAAALAPRSTSATLGPHFCFDTRTNSLFAATAFIDTPGTLLGTQGNDVLVGSTGADVIKGLGGNDIICGFPLSQPDDKVLDTIDGAAGNDDIFGSGTLDGGSGNDYIVASGSSSIAKGGSGNDTVRADNGADADGGSGNDHVVSGPNGADALYGRSGEDFVENVTSANLLDCGSNVNQYTPNGAPSVLHCELEVTPP